MTRSQAYQLTSSASRVGLNNPDFATTGDKVAEWFQPQIDRKLLKQLMKRENARPLADYLFWLALLAFGGTLGVITYGSWVAVPVFLVYGVIYSSSDARSHELGHGTVFRSPRLNSFFYYLTLFMTLKEPVLFRWRHARHHTATIHVGLDPEIQVKRPADLLKIAADYFFLVQAIDELGPSVRHAFGNLSTDAYFYVPRSEHQKMIWSSRLLLAMILAVIALSVAMASWLPLLLLGLPRFYGGWLHSLGSLTQHAGLAEDATDHRLNTRTVRLNPVFQYLYSNLNFHIEHHIFPMVPYYNLPRLHEAVADQLPRTYSGVFDVYREIVPALWRQAHEPDYYVRRTLPGLHAAQTRDADISLQPGLAS